MFFSEEASKIKNFYNANVNIVSKYISTGIKHQYVTTKEKRKKFSQQNPNQECIVQLSSKTLLFVNKVTGIIQYF